MGLNIFKIENNRRNTFKKKELRILIHKTLKLNSKNILKKKNFFFFFKQNYKLLKNRCFISGKTSSVVTY